MHPELYRQVAGERDFLREQRAELILQLSRKDEEIRKCRQRLDCLAERGMEKSAANTKVAADQAKIVKQMGERFDATDTRLDGICNALMLIADALNIRNAVLSPLASKRRKATPH